MQYSRSVLLSWIILTVAYTIDAKTWRGITPLKSTRADVERLLGPSKGVQPKYSLPEMTVVVVYSSCRCGDECKKDDWDVPSDTVTLIRVDFKGLIKLSDLAVDLTKFEKRPGDEDVPGQLSYVSQEEGFAIETGSAGYVGALIYGPQAKDNHLRCRPDSRKPKGNNGIIPLRSTQTDVERILGPAKTIGSVPTYFFNDERVELFYVRHPCGDPRNYEKWNVPSDTVLSIHVVPKTPRRVSEMLSNVSNFRKEKGMWDVPNSSRLVNDEEGITLFLDDDLVVSYSHGPRASDRSLRCPGYSEEEEGRRMQNCLRATLKVDCASSETELGKPVACKATSDAPQVIYRWAVSSGAAVQPQSGNNAKVTVSDPKSKTATVIVSIVSPKVCFDSASAELRVVKH
jgi:hypothetical protein